MVREGPTEKRKAFPSRGLGGMGYSVLSGWTCSVPCQDHQGQD